jgi:hypothetical protein
LIAASGMPFLISLSLSRLKYREIYRCVKPREWGTRVLDRERIGGPCSCACAVWLALWPANNCAARSSSVVVVAAVLYLWKQQEDGQGQRMGRSSRAKDSPCVRAHGMVLRRNVRAFFGGLGTTRRRGVRAPGDLVALPGSTRFWSSRCGSTSERKGLARRAGYGCKCNVMLSTVATTSKAFRGTACVYVAQHSTLT